MEHTITNKTRTLGFGYTCWTRQGDEPNAPDYTGTIKEVLSDIRNDRTYQSMRSGGTYLATDWFYKGKRIIDAEDAHGDHSRINELICAMESGEWKWIDELVVMTA